MLGVPLMSVPIRSSPLADPDREVPIRYLLASGQCTPACLLALVDDGSCQCRCDGTFHGIGADLTVNVERHIPMGTVAVPVGDIKTRNQALQMPDGCGSTTTPSSGAVTGGLSINAHAVTTGHVGGRSTLPDAPRTSVAWVLDDHHERCGS